MLENLMAVQAYEFLRRFDFFRDEIDLEWLTRFVRMADRGWIYSLKDEGGFSALAGAYRVESVEEAEAGGPLPEKQDGSILFIPFAVSRGSGTTALLRILKQYLKENPGITSVVYYKKIRNAEGMSSRFVKRRVTVLREKAEPVSCFEENAVLN